jgi:6-phosphogluconate dehydrogenase
MVGLGRMGSGLTRRLLRDGHRVVAYDRSPETIKAVATDGAEPADTLEQLRDKLAPPRTVWVMVPSGAPTQEAIDRLAGLLEPGDVLIDGGNSNFHDSVARAQALAGKGVSFLDVGTSGGVWGLKEGFCLMVGGPGDAFAHAEPVFRSLAAEGGYAHLGPSGAGHHAKMIHNGIEYGLLQAYAEGFEILHASDYDFDLAKVAELWRHGSVIRSWLLDLTASAFAKDPELAGFRGWVEDSGEGRWAVQEALDKEVPAPVINLSLIMRLRSRVEDSYAGKLISALRNEFGGHAVHRSEVPR